MKTKIILLALLLNTLVFVDLLAQEIPLVYDVENTGADCPEPPLPSFSELPTIEALPDPFKWADTSLGRITSVGDWRCRRAEIGAEVEHYELGTKPEPPENLKSSFTEDTLIKLSPLFEGGDTLTLSCALLTITVVEGEDTLTLTAPVNLPEGEGPFPAVIGVGYPWPGMIGSLLSDIFTSRGIAIIHYIESQVTNAWSGVRGDGPFFDLYPDTKRGKFIAFAWGASRIIDGLEKCPEANIDLSHLAVTGCSYAGKIALFSGAFDERIALTIPQEPGGGGDAAWRVSETLSGVETLRNAQGQYWYYQDLSLFNNAVTKLPYDHHEVMAMIAPRALLLIGNPSMVWLAEESGHVSCKAAHEIWKAFGVPDRFGFSKVGHDDHCVLPESQRPEVIAFVEKFLLGDTSANTNVEVSPYDPDLSIWITWDTPELEGASVPLPVGDFNLIRNDPNPFSSVTTIDYYLEKESYVQLSVYDITGKRIRTLINKKQSAGKQTSRFDGSELPSGIYIYTLKVSNFAKSKKMLLLR
jgi:hypothetical protein